MSNDDFFAGVDAQLSKMAAAEATAKDTAAENREFLQEVVIRLAPIVASYEQQLGARNIKVEVRSYPTSISFTMRYKDGGHFGLNISGSRQNNRIEMSNSFTNDDGRNYTSTSGASYDKSNWNDSLFKDELEKCIKDFLFYADRHGGVATR